MKIDTSRLNEVIRSNIETLCRHFFPAGARDGVDWRIADISGDKGKSLRICLTQTKGGVWKDEATGDKGGFVKLLMHNRNLSFPAAVDEISRCLGVDLEEQRQRDEYSKNGAAVDWAKCRKLTTEEESQLAAWRGYSVEFVRWLSEHELIKGYGANGDARWVFPIHLNGKVAGTHSRLAIWNGSSSSAWTIYPTKTKGGPGVQPLNIGNLKGATTAHVSESSWDLLALCDKLSMHQTDGFIALCTRGAANSKLASTLPDSIREVYLWPQNDEAGQKWAGDVVRYLPKRAITKVVPTPAEHADLNDWTRSGATADDLLIAIRNAEQPASEERDVKLWVPESLVVLSEEDIDPSQTLLGNRWLEREQSLIVVGPSGVGKSVWVIQLSFLVAAGLSPFEISNQAPRKILIIQAEDKQKRPDRNGSHAACAAI
jgi:hypothetical protein